MNGGEGSPWVPLHIQAWAPSLWRRIRYKRPLSSYTHNFIRLLNHIPRRRLRIALYNRLCARSIVTLRRGMGYKMPPWVKGLIAQNNENNWWGYYPAEWWRFSGWRNHCKPGRPDNAAPGVEVYKFKKLYFFKKLEFCEILNNFWANFGKFYS